MPIAESLTRFVTSIMAVATNRLELASIEIEEESLRIYSALLMSLLALFCGTFALALLVVLCIVLFWESHRYTILMFFIAVFALACWLLVRRLTRQYQAKPPFLSYTLAEIRKDIEAIKPRPKE